MEAGERSGLRKDFTSVSHFHYQLAKRRSTGAVTGFMRFVSSSMDAVPAEAMASIVYGLRLEEGELRWEEREMLYRDQPSADGKYLPVTFEARCRLFCENGKARYEYDGVCLDVDPADLSRRPSRAVFPKFLSREP